VVVTLKVVNFGGIRKELVLAVAEPVLDCSVIKGNPVHTRISGIANVCFLGCRHPRCGVQHQNKKLWWAWFDAFKCK